MSAANTLIDNTVQTARRTRRAYFGLFGMGYDLAVARAEKRRAQINSLFGNAVSRGETIETDARAFFDKAKKEAEALTTDTLKKAKKEAKDLKKDAKTVKTAVTKTAKKNAKVAETKVTKAVEQTAERVEEKAADVAKAPKTDVADIADKYEPYVEKVRAYDKDADAMVVKKIVDHLGIALQSRDGMFVACSDEDERKVVAQSWLKKKLGLNADDETLDAKVLETCEQMKADRMKDRVTFYYLAAKSARKLGTL